MKISQIAKVATTCLFLIFCISNTYAQQNEIQNKQEETEKIETKINEELVKAKKEEIEKMITECVDELRLGLLNIDKKTEELKTKEEYKKYPSIRLNVEIPLFGLSSIINNKLKITNDISTSDVVSGYSIRDIVTKNKVKVVSFSVGSVVVITRDVNLNSDISLSDCATVLLKLMQYITQVEKTNEFLDIQINNVFTSYIPKDRADKISDVLKRVNDINKELLNIDKNITYINLIASDKDAYAQYIKQYNEIALKAFEINKIMKNVLISDEAIIQTQKLLKTLENELLKFKNTVDDNYNIIDENIDKLKMLKDLKINFVEKKEKIEKYINDSTVIEKEIIRAEEITENTENTENTTEKMLYSVTSKDVVEYMSNCIKIIDEKEEYIKKEENKKEELLKNDDMDDKKIDQKSIKEQNDAFLEELSILYSEYVYRENKFYLDNLNLCIKDTTVKMSDLIKYTDKNVLQNIKYIYLDLPDNIVYYLALNDQTSNISTNNLTLQIISEISKILQTNININKMHLEIINDSVKDSSRD